MKNKEIDEIEKIINDDSNETKEKKAIIIKFYEL
jgi:hypothetical protein